MKSSSIGNSPWRYVCLPRLTLEVDHDQSENDQSSRHQSLASNDLFYSTKVRLGADLELSKISNKSGYF